MKRWFLPLLPVLALVSCKGDDPDPVEQELCYVDEVPIEATRRWGWQDDGSYVGLGGRRMVPAGSTVVLTRMAVDVALHPDLPVVYVAEVDRSNASIAVVDMDSLEILQTLSVSNASVGMLVDGPRDRLYVPSGDAGYVQMLDILEDGTLATGDNVWITDGEPTGLALSDDGQTLWTGDFYLPLLYEIDLESGQHTRTIELSCEAWDLAHVPGRDELYISDLNSETISVVDLAAGAEVATLTAPTSPAGLAVSPDGERVFAAISNGGGVAVIDTDQRAIVEELTITEGDLLDDDGGPLLNSNITSVWYGDDDRLYAARGSDNAVSVIDAESLEVLGAIPTAMYPFDVELGSDGRLVVAEYRGGGVDQGSVTVIDVPSLDLAITTDEVIHQVSSPREQFPFTCDGFFPIPPTPEQESPIEYVFVVVKENKTFDCLFGDMGEELDVEADPDHQRYPAETTPNQRALMREFNTSDNFYVNARESDSGHVALTSAHMTHWVEWMWVETSRNGGELQWPIAYTAEPSVGNFFTHLMDHDVSIQIYGEIVGMFAEAEDGSSPMDYSDIEYPGGPFYNTAVLDEEKAQYVVDEVGYREPAQLTFMLLPNDHTVGTSSGQWTPESMVADNDYGLGILVQGLSNSEYWDRTAIFVLQDDPQGCGDHINDSRSPLLVISPYAKRGGYVSPTNTDFLSIFATIERILGVPPMGRPDATATPMWDLFQPEPDLTPYELRDRIPHSFNDAKAYGADVSARLDFSGPDRSPELTPLLDSYMLWRLGRISREEAERRLDAPRLALDDEEWEELEEEAEEETFAFDQAWVQYEAWCKEKGLPAPVRP